MPYKKDLKAFTNSVIATLNKSFNQSQLKPIGEFAKETIYKRVKSGQGVDNDESDSANKKKLKALSTSYIAFRNKYPGSGAFFGPRKSNLTYTGQMLDAINFKVSQGVVTVFIKNNKRSGSKHTNAEIAEFVSEQGRPFFTLTVPEQRVLFRKVEKNLRDFIRLAFKKG